MQGKKFQRRIEDFVCAHCGAAIKGSGYTDHCPQCLWGKHVDINPGDRAATCGAMMRPVAIEGSTPAYRIHYRCEKCRHAFLVKAHVSDRSEALVALAKEVALKQNRL